MQDGGEVSLNTDDGPRVIDLHCDTFLRLYEEGGGLGKNRFQVDLTGLRQANSLAQVFALFVDRESCGEEGPYGRYRRMLDLARRELESWRDEIRIVRSPGLTYSPPVH